MIACTLIKVGPDCWYAWRLSIRAKCATRQRRERLWDQVLRGLEFSLVRGDWQTRFRTSDLEYPRRTNCCCNSRPLDAIWSKISFWMRDIYSHRAAQVRSPMYRKRQTWLDRGAFFLFRGLSTAGGQAFLFFMGLSTWGDSYPTQVVKKLNQGIHSPNCRKKSRRAFPNDVW